NFEVGADAVVLLLAHHRPHFRFAFQRSAQLDALGVFRHGFNEFRIDFLFHEDAAARGADFALIDEYAEERAVDGSFPVCALKENVWRLAAELEGDALEGVRRALDNDLANCGAAGERDFVHAGMRNQCGSRRFAKPVDNVDDARWQAQFLKPAGDFHHAERRLLGRLQDAGAARGDGGSELPGSHHKRIVPRNDLAGYADRLTQSETQGIRRNRIDVTQNFVREAGVIFETGRGVGDVVFRFDD